MWDISFASWLPLSWGYGEVSRDQIISFAPKFIDDEISLTRNLHRVAPKKAMTTLAGRFTNRPYGMTQLRRYVAACGFAQRGTEGDALPARNTAGGPIGEEIEVAEAEFPRLLDADAVIPLREDRDHRIPVPRLP